MGQKTHLWVCGGILLLSLSATIVGQRNRTHTTTGCGTVVEAIALCLSPSAEPGSVTLAVRNTGPKDAVLKLGIMIANGARQYPNTITLILTDANRNVHQGS